MSSRTATAKSGGRRSLPGGPGRENFIIVKILLMVSSHNVKLANESRTKPGLRALKVVSGVISVIGRCIKRRRKTLSGLRKSVLKTAPGMSGIVIKK